MLTLDLHPVLLGLLLLGAVYMLLAALFPASRKARFAPTKVHIPPQIEFSIGVWIYKVLEWLKLKGAPPTVSILDMCSSYWISQALYVVTKLEIPALLVDGPKSISTLAAARNLHSASLFRVMRALTTVHVFEQVSNLEESEPLFELTPIADMLRREHPLSQFGVVCSMCEEQYRAWADLLHTVKTGETSFDFAYGKPFYNHLDENAESRELFDGFMTGVGWESHAAIARDFNFSQYQTVVDVGGCEGALLQDILKVHRRVARGIVFDRPQVTGRFQEAQTKMKTTEGNRLSFVGGDFFVPATIPSEGNAYILKEVMHNWSDDDCVTILRNVASRISPGAHILIIDAVVADRDPLRRFKTFLDLHMLAIVGGRERTEVEFQNLLERAGLRLVGVVPTRSMYSIVQAMKQ
jgi:hypothetical protein